MGHNMPIGISEFKKVRESGAYYVDKSQLIAEVLQDRSEVILLPRPRRFGKTLNLTMLREFFDDRIDNFHLFENLSISTDATSMKQLGGYPTLYITFKGLHCDSLSSCQQQLRGLVKDMFDAQWERIQASHLPEHRKQEAHKIATGQADLNTCRGGLLLLSRLLQAITGKRVVILIDEYDTPIHAGHRHGYREEIVHFMRDFLGGGLKDNPALEKGVLTGILRVAKDSIFSGLNNLKVYSLLDKPFSAYFGFTEAEVLRMLAFAGMDARAGEVQRWYNGYRFGNYTMYNPWSILSILSDPNAPFVPHWVHTSDNQMVRDLVVEERAISLAELTLLLEGGVVKHQVDPHVALNDLKPETVWGLMLLSGYLTTDGKDPDSNQVYGLCIPNLEVRTFFESTVSYWLGEQTRVDELLAPLLSEDMPRFAAILAETVAQVLSYHDTAKGDSERVYHVFLAGLLVHLRNSHQVLSNREAGFGRYDLVVAPKQSGKTGFIFEFKRGKEKELEQLAQSALEQISINDYGATLRAQSIQRIRHIGLAFDGKRIALASALWQAGVAEISLDPPVFVEGKTPIEPTDRHAGALGARKKFARFRVLLLASELDLGKVRRKVAEYLSQRGMEMLNIENGFSPDCDQVVLLQAWQWQGGEYAQIWEQAPKAKRSLFLINDSSPWPFNLVDITAVAEIKSFREQYACDAHFFDLAEELPALVGESLVFIRGTDKGQTSTGLSALERAYLKLNLPAWRSGRNQLTRGAIKSGGYETSRIFNENLYVAMDGVSQRFGRNSKGEISPLPNRADRPVEQTKKRELGEEIFENRLPLTLWASAEALPWLVISGSPGAGKTVFLTRFAAQLAAQLLGEELDPEIGLDIPRPQNGLGPIPVVLEAVVLADQAAGLSGVAAALRQALAIAGQHDLPSTELLERQLSEGRFLLLVDALDEVGSEQQRRELVDLLKGLSTLCPGRLLLTTRSARYTGIMPFGPEFEIVELMPFNREQVIQFCRQYRIDQKELPGFEQDLAEAIVHLEQREQGGDGESFSGNALMLTTLCWLYKRERRLPDDRVGLCSRLVEGLCEARPQAGPDGKILTSDEKRKHLSHIALAMQQSGSPSYSYGKCLDVIAANLPSSAKAERSRHERLLRCLVEQTGLMYYEANAKGEEQLRFVHRLLREYLAALCLCGEDRTMDQLVADLARDGHLIDPFWYDVVRMLPGVANSQQRAETYAQALLKRARSADPSAARLWGTLAATLKENHHLYPRFDTAGFCREALKRYEAEGGDWPREARFLLLEGIDMLGDPRLDWQREDYWVRFEPGRFIMGDAEVFEDEREVEVTEPFALAKYPVTHGEYQRFVDDGGYRNPAFWSKAGLAWLKASKEHGEPQNIPGFCQPNQPRVGVCYHEAEAYCAWLSAIHKANYPETAEQIYLPSEEQWEYAARGKDGRPYPWRLEDVSVDHANFGRKVGRTSPVGAYPKGQTPEGLWDMGGNVWEWSSTLDEPSGAYRVLRGGGWFSDARGMRSAYRHRSEPGYRYGRDTGFRLARGQAAFIAKKIERRSD